MSRQYDVSPMWRRNQETVLTKDASADLTGFKSGKVNYKLALWDPQPNGVRYLKELIHTACARLTPRDWDRLRRIHHRDVGSPIAVRYDGETICLDYLQAVLELGFIADRIELDGLTVLEIGAGYGRTCHALLSNHDIAEYHIVDLDNALELSRGYLRAVLDDERFARIRFHPIADADTALPDHVGLCVNIDSFAEMDAATVRNYLALVDERCRYLYVNNPVGKYREPSLDNHSQGEEVVAMALSTGLLRDVIDIHDTRAVRAQAGAFRAAYSPGGDWEVLADGPAPVWSYYWQALYRRAR